MSSKFQKLVKPIPWVPFYKSARTYVRKNKKALLVVLGAILFLGVLVGMYSIPEKNTITLKDDGFHPRTLTIKVGETVTFKNNRAKYYWPASDFHPTHNDYPDFDPKEPIQPKATWSYTFSEPGTYNYHDHLAAYYFGMIVVTDASGNTADGCSGGASSMKCWQNEIFLALTKSGVDGAYKVVLRLYDEEPNFAGACHTITHNLGLASYQFYRSDPKTILSPQAMSCAAGFYHGFMEGYLGATGDIMGAANVCDRIGEEISDETPDARLQCYHGIGHGSIETAVASAGVFESVDGVIASSLTMCEEASTGVDERYRCVSGVYNAIANFYIVGQYGLSLKDSDPLLVCSRQKEEYKEACYGNMNSMAMEKMDRDLRKAFAYILTIPDEAYRAVAVRYLGGLAAGQGRETPSAATMAANCRVLPESYRLDCIKGFSHGLLEHGTPEKEHEGALAFCKAEALSEDERNACYEYVLGTLRGWYIEPRADAICASVEPSLQHLCAK